MYLFKIFYFSKPKITNLVNINYYYLLFSFPLFQACLKKKLKIKIINAYCVYDNILNLIPKFSNY